jgi:hypothetical protein
MELGRKSRRLLCKVLVLGCLKTIARVWRRRRLKFCHALDAFRDKVLHAQ